MEENRTRKAVRNPLGRGLSALVSTPVPSVYGNAAESFSSNTNAEGGHDAGNIRSIDLDDIVSNPAQPRREFKELELKDLAESIRSVGVIQPVVLRPAANSSPARYQLVAGERRWRAARLAGLKTIPAIIENYVDKQALEIALIENIQREDLNPFEEAQAYKRLIEEFSLTQKELAERVGKDRASVANYLRLLSLPEQVAALIRDGQLSMGHAKAILTVKEPSAQISLAKKTVNETLSVRALETIVSRVVVLDAGRRSPSGAVPGKSASGGGAAGQHCFPEIADRLRQSLGTKVSLKHHKSGKGRVEIEYFSEQELERIVEHICR